MIPNKPGRATAKLKLAPDELDPVFVHSRREAVVILLVWLLCLLWSVPYCYLNGYIDGFEPAEFSTTLGIPSWLFWGIGMPWVFANLVTIWFCFCFMKHDDLGQGPEDRAADVDASTESTDRETEVS